MTKVAYEDDAVQGRIFTVHDVGNDINAAVLTVCLRDGMEWDDALQERALRAVAALLGVEIDDLQVIEPKVRTRAAIEARNIGAMAMQASFRR